MNVPVDLLRPMIDSYLADKQISVEELSVLVGLHEDTIRRRLREKTLTFEMADLILCKVADPVRAWRNPPLDFYYHEGVIPPDDSLPAKCENPECEEWFALNSDPGPHDSSWKRQRYCCSSCEHRHWHIRKRQSKAEEGERVCASPTCGNTFIVKRSKSSGAWMRQKFCTPRCANRESLRAWRLRQRALVAA